MATVIAEFFDFSGGHWGNEGGIHANPNQWGGINMLPTRQGTLAPASASRPFVFDESLGNGQLWGMFYAWGLDGRVYIVQETDANSYQVSAFDPDPTEATLTLADIDSAISQEGFTLAFQVDWATQAEKLFATFYGLNTQVVTLTLPSSYGIGKLTGSEGDAPGGRCIAFHGERLLIGGINDTDDSARFGDHRNRIVFSGNLETNPGDFTFWPDLQYFDVGGDPSTYVSGMYPIRDQLVIVLSNQEVWIMSGVPGVNARLRRVYGFHRGSGGVRVFQSNNGTVDPSQTRVWLYDHGVRGPARFNGATYNRIPAFGSPIGSRTGESDSPFSVRGASAAFGGPDEFIMDGIAMPRTQRLNPTRGELVRLNQIFGIVDKKVLTG